MRIRVAAILLSLLIVPASVAFGRAQPAAAATTFTTLTDKATTACLDSDAAGNVYTLACNGGTYQRWQLISVDGFGDDELIDSQTGLCLDSNTAGSIYTLACNGGAFQHWTVTPNDASGSSPSELRDVSTGRCLESAGGSAHTLACSGGDDQRWQQPIVGFNLRITAGATSLCVGIWAGLAGSWGCTSNPDQTWHWGASNGYGYYQLINGNNQCLGVAGYSISSGADINADNCSGADSQFWARTSNPSSTTSYLMNYNAPWVISTQGGTFVNGNQLVQRAAAGGANQLWSSPSPTFNIAANAAGLGGPWSGCVGIYAGAAGLWACTTHPDQVWRWGTSNTAGAQLVNGYGQCLGVASGSTAIGAAISAGPCTGAADQYWTRVATGSPSYWYLLQNAKSHYVLATNGGAYANGTPLIQWSVSGTADQNWSGV